MAKEETAQTPKVEHAKAGTVLVPHTKFGYGKQIYMAGEKYVLAANELPSNVVKKFAKKGK